MIHSPDPLRRAYGDLLVAPLRLVLPQGSAQVSPEECPPLGGAAVRLAGGDAGNEVELRPDDAAAWNGAQWLALDAWQDSDTAGSVLLAFWAADEAEPHLTARLGLFPRLRTRLTFPLEVLDGQRIFLERTPGRLKGVVQGHRLQRDELVRLTLTLLDSGGEQTLWLRNVALLDAEPAYPTPDDTIVDELGQWQGCIWHGTTPDEASLRRELHVAHLTAQTAEFPDGWNGHGGSNAHQFEASPHFRVQQRDGRWWLVDPEGGGFFSTGLDSVNPGEAGAVVPGTERLFAWLPQPDGEFAAASGPARQGLASVNFAVANLVRTFGDEWYEKWAEMTAGRLRQWGFNTVANWSEPRFRRQCGLPYVVQWPRFATTTTCLFRDFPDVFHPQYLETARECAQSLLEFEGDANLIGYFMVNEPHWAFGKFNIASEMLEANPGTATRQALAAHLQGRYAGDVAVWQRAWGLPLQSFRQIETDIFQRLAETSPVAAADLWDFSKEMVHRYVWVPCQAARKVDRQHLNLGMRYAWISSELCYQGGEYFDVFSINNYDMEPPLSAIAEITRRTGKPVLIGEYHFGATDRGLPASGLRRVTSQEERGVAYRRYLELCAADPNVVGAHYFILNDQALLGRFDGENYQIGFVDCCHTAYSELVEAARQSHERLYGLKSGALSPVERTARELPRIY